MFIATCNLIRLNILVTLMSKSNGSPPTNLLSRLKIVHSFYTETNNKKRQLKQQSRTTSHNENVSNEISRNYFSKPCPQTYIYKENKKVELNKISTPKISSNNKNSSAPINRNISRQFSTRGQYFTTSAGYDSPKFIIEICQGILTNKIKNIVVMAGAGISCPSGIPDFRTPGTGLYDNLKQYKIPYPEAIFDIDYFASNPKPFFALAKEIFPSGKYRPNKVHYFLKLLQDKKLLRRVYTQNIDGLERLAGVNDLSLVEAHGTFASACCISCSEKYSALEMKASIDKEEICYCRKCRGIVKPDIVFFGEDLPLKFNLYRSDFRQTDLLLVMGTSLEVEPFASIIDSTKFNTPRILINKQAVGVFRSKGRVNDNCILGDIINGIDTIVKVLRWDTELERIMREGEEKQINFMDTIIKSKPSFNNRHFSTFTNDQKSLRGTLPPLPNSIAKNRKRSSSEDDSSSESSQSEITSSSFDSDF